MRKFLKRHLGRILVDAGFVSRGSLASALQEQRRTKELLGQVLVRMGVLQPGDVKASLLLQRYLLNPKDAASLAAGERQLLGSLLVESGRLSQQDLDRAMEEKRRSGERLGEVLVRLDCIGPEQLEALLDFQAHQEAHAPGPFRLGELLVTTGDLSREQLEAALAKKNGSGKRLGEVLVEEGYVPPGRVSHCIGLQKMLVHAALSAIFSVGIAATGHAADVNLQWDPSPDTAVAGYKVYYQADSQVLPFQGSGSVQGAAPIDVQGRLTATVTGLEPGHTYYFAVTAYDDAGNESVYSNVASAETLYPPPSIINPVGGTLVSGLVTVDADPSGDPSVTGMQFFVDGVLRGADSSAPYQFQWDASALSPGSHTLVVRTSDPRGNLTESAPVSVQVAAKDSTPPSVSLSSPLPGAVVSGTATISAAAADDTGVSKVELYKDGVLLFAGNTAPFNFSWDTSSVPDGTHSLAAKAYDAAGHVAQSGEISVVVKNTLPEAGAQLTVADALTALNIAAGKLAPTPEQVARLDLGPVVNGRYAPDGVVNTGDVVVLLSKLTGK